MTKQETIDSIIAECNRQGLSLLPQIAYVLATVKHETGDKFQPVEEAYYLGEPKRTQYLKSKAYYPYYGRGYVQLTWLDNYRKYAVILEKDFINHPELAAEHENALFILVHGFLNGTFTGQKITQWINTVNTDFIGARRCVNALDKAEVIAEYARQYLVELQDQAAKEQPPAESPPKEVKTMDLRQQIVLKPDGWMRIFIEQRIEIHVNGVTLDEWREIPFVVNKE